MSILNYGQIERKYGRLEVFHPESPKDGELRITVVDRTGQAVCTDVYQLVEKHSRVPAFTLYRYAGRKRCSPSDIAQLNAYITRCAEEHRSQPHGKDI